MPTNYARQRAAQAWDKPKTHHLPMSIELREAFAEVLDQIIREMADETARRQLAQFEEKAELAQLDDSLAAKLAALSKAYPEEKGDA